MNTKLAQHAIQVQWMMKDTKFISAQKLAVNTQ
jgi:hypothetical protein